MGDKGGKKDKSKEQKQKQSKDSKKINEQLAKQPKKKAITRSRVQNTFGF